MYHQVQSFFPAALHLKLKLIEELLLPLPSVSKVTVDLKKERKKKSDMIMIIYNIKNTQ